MLCPNGWVVPLRIALTWSGFNCGWCSSSSATAPETTPVAIDRQSVESRWPWFFAVTTWSGSSVSRLLPGTRMDTIRRPGRAGPVRA